MFSVLLGLGIESQIVLQAFLFGDLKSGFRVGCAPATPRLTRPKSEESESTALAIPSGRSTADEESQTRPVSGVCLGPLLPIHQVPKGPLLPGFWVLYCLTYIEQCGSKHGRNQKNPRSGGEPIEQCPQPVWDWNLSLLSLGLQSYLLRRYDWTL